MFILEGSSDSQEQPVVRLHSQAELKSIANSVVSVLREDYRPRRVSMDFGPSTGEILLHIGLIPAMVLPFLGLFWLIG